MGLKGTGETTTYLPGECVESAAASGVAPDVRDVCCWLVWMVVRFVCPVCVVRVPLCARVSRVCPVCVPAPPGVLLPVPTFGSRFQKCSNLQIRSRKIGDFSILVEIFCARSAQQNCAAQRRQAAPQAPPGGAQRRRRRQAQTRRLSPPLSPLFCTTFHFPRS